MRYDYASIGFYTFDCLGWPFKAIPPGEGTSFIDEITLAVSGAAGTAVIAAAKMGLHSLAVGGVGSDLMGDWVLDRVASFGVDISALHRIDGAVTSSSIVTSRADGSRPALHMKGATGIFRLSETEVDQATDARVVHLGGVGLMDRMDGAPNARLLQRAKAKGATTTVDIFAGSPDDLPDVKAVLPYTDYFIPSIEEARALSGLVEVSDLAAFFFDLGTTCCIFTRGGEGASYLHRDGAKFKMPAFDIDVKCTCGCGDAFNAGFAVALCRSFDTETAVRFAQATSALTAMGLGSQAGVRSFEHTWDFMKTARQKPHTGDR